MTEQKTTAGIIGELAEQMTDLAKMIDPTYQDLRHYGGLLARFSNLLRVANGQGRMSLVAAGFAAYATKYQITAKVLLIELVYGSDREQRQALDLLESAGRKAMKLS